MKFPFVCPRCRVALVHPETFQRQLHDSINWILQASGDMGGWQCAGINRHVVGNERVLRERSSKPSWPRVLRLWSRGGSRSVNRGIGGLGIELRKTQTGMPTLLPEREGETNTDTKLVRRAIPRSRRPHARRETTCTRTGRPHR